MRLRAIALMALGLAVLAPGPGAAQRFHDGYYLHGMCRHSRPACLAYVVAIADVMSGLAYLHGYRTCLPPGLSDAQVADAVAAWLVANRKLRANRAEVLAARALAQTFPCQ